MLVGNVYSKTVHKYMSPSDALSEVYRTDNVWIFQVPELPGAAAVKEARKKALAEEAAKRKAQYGGYYNYTPYGTPVENEQDMALCVTARTVCVPTVPPMLHVAGHACVTVPQVERKYQYSVAVTRQNEMCADAFVVPFRFLAGSYDAFPTGKQVPLSLLFAL